MQRQANVYVTLLTSDSFLIAVQVLAYSLKRVNSQYGLVVMVSSQVSSHVCEQLRREDGIQLIQVTDIPSPGANESHVPGWINSGYTKLHVFNLIQFSKVVYIDADCLVLENVDELFQRPVAFAAAPDVFPPDRFNAGVLIVQPDATLFQQMQSSIATISSYDSGDTGFLNAFFPDWFTSSANARLPFRYNAQMTLYLLTHEQQPGYWQAIQPIKILHYSSSPKPWENTAKKGQLELLWWQIMVESQMGRLPIQ